MMATKRSESNRAAPAPDAKRAIPADKAGKAKKPTSPKKAAAKRPARPKGTTSVGKVTKASKAGVKKTATSDVDPDLGADAPKPPEADYPAWLKDRLDKPLGPQVSGRYQMVSNQLAADVLTTLFWTDLSGALDDLDAEYQQDTKYRLLAPTGDRGYSPVTKPYQSLVLKTYRRNVLDNRTWPAEPEGGWITPDNWFTTVRDIVRTTIVVKYLDGVQLVSDLIQRIAKAHELPCEVSPEARDEGYYAYHVTVTLPLRVPGQTWEVETLNVPVEIQVATQVQDVIRTLTHAFYEDRRRRPASSEKWQWNYRSPEFVPNYLGHILHYVEGMIMEVRDREGNQT